MNLRTSLRPALAAGLVTALGLSLCGCPGQDPGTCGPCDVNARCDTTLTPNACVCQPGYAGNGASCTPVTCPALSLEHGTVTPGGDGTFGQTAAHGCAAGYKLEGDASRKCQADGTWSGSAPTCFEVVNGCDDAPCVHGPCTATGDTGGYTCGPCEAGWSGANCDQPVSCPALEDPLHGTVAPRSGTAGSAVTYGCQAGYTLAGEAARTCQADGTWSGAAPTCAPNPCAPDLAAPAHGAVSATAGVTGDVASYTCEDGYTLVGNTTRLCQTDGAWSGADPSCSATQTACTPNPCAHGTCTPAGAGGFTCACETGWTGAACDTEVICSGAAAPAHGSVSTASAAYGSSVTYSCDAGYSLVGAASRACQADGAFAGTVPTCEPNPCAPDLAAPAHGSVSMVQGRTGDLASYACDGGYALSGSTSRLCQTDGTWSGVAPTCTPVQAGCSPNPCQNAGVCAPAGASGFACTCADGWTGAICDLVVSCSGATAPAHGSVSAASAPYGSAVTYACDAGYSVLGTATRTCQASGSFSGAAPTCAANPCAPTLAAPANGAVSATTGVTGEVVTYSCSGGYALSGGATRTCQADGAWSGAAPTCTLVTTGCTPNPCVHSASCTPVGATGYSCGTCDPGWMGANCGQPITCTGAVAPSHGTVSAASASFGQAVSYVCDPGYTRSGLASRTCQADGSFDGAAPTCLPVDCGPAPVVANAAAPVLSGGAGGGATPTLGATAAYTCAAGFTKAGVDATCGVGGTWSAAPTCAAVDCGPAPYVPNAGAPTVSGGVGGGTSPTFGASAAYACDPGYARTGANPTCGAGGSWSLAPACTVIDCGAPPVVSGAGAPIVSGGLGGGATPTFNAAAAYTCNPGHTKAGANPTCGASGWGAAPTCTPVDCGAPPAVSNAGTPAVSGGASGGASTTYGATAAYTCLPNYAKAGANPTCGASGSWSAAPTCSPVSCGTPPAVANAGAPAVSGGLGGGATPTVGATAVYTCNVGYTIKVGADPVCSGGGTWGTAPTCNPVNCGAPPAVANAGAAVVSGGAGGGTSPTYLATAAYTCNPSYTKSGTDSSCLATGVWSGSPTCTAAVCGTHTDVVYRLVGQFRIGNTTLGMGNQTFENLGANATTPAFAGAGNSTPFTGGGSFTNGFARLRFHNDATGAPQAGAVNLVEWYFPLEFTQTAGATIAINTDHSVGLLASGLSNCGGGDATCTNHAPTVSRACTANAQGTLSGTTLSWGACAPVTNGQKSWNYVNARAATGAGCATGWNGWGHAGPCTAGSCFMVPACSLGDAYQTWNQQLAPLTFSGTAPLTATFTMGEIQIPNCSNSSTTWIKITSSTVLQAQCGSTPGVDLVCNAQ